MRRVDPGRELVPDVLALLAEEGGRSLSRSRIRAALGIDTEGARALRAALDDLVATGLIVCEGRRYSRPPPGKTAARPRGGARSERAGVGAGPRGGPGRGPSARLVGPLTFTRSGHAILAAGTAGATFVPAPLRAGACPGDTVEAEVFTDALGRRAARVVDVRERTRGQLVGVFAVLGRRGGHIRPADATFDRAVRVLPGQALGAREGDIVVARIEGYPRHARGAVIARVTRVLGRLADPSTDVPRVVHERGLSAGFAPDVLAEAAQVAREPGEVERRTPGRVDLRDRKCFTIDGVEAKDFDDAVGLETDGGDTVLWVHVADVSHYVREGTRLEAAALERATSVYFPEAAIPMLPPVLSDDICSLKPGVDRLVLSVRLVLDGSGDRRSYEVVPAVIRSAARLDYAEVERLLVSGDPEVRRRLGPLWEELVAMQGLATRLKEGRSRRGSLELAIPEAHVDLGEGGEVRAIRPIGDPVARNLIEEFMIAANEAVADLAMRSMDAFVYRVHETPDPSKMEELGRVARRLGVALEAAAGSDPRRLAEFLSRLEGRAEGPFLRTLALRSLKQARYHPAFLGHFGLASPGYTHFTSPIRRYPDLLVHRLVKHAKGFDRLGADRLESIAGSLATRAEHASARERMAQEAERRMLAIKAARYMRPRLGRVLPARVSGVVVGGLFVALEEALVEGFVPASTLPRDRYLTEDHQVTGQYRGLVLRLGDRIQVRAVGADPLLGEVTFAYERTAARRG